MIQKTILVDLDGVLADFEADFLRNYQAKYPGQFFVPYDQRKSFYIRDEYPEDLIPQVESIYFAKGFIQNLTPITGAIEAVKEMHTLDHDVKICSTLLSGNPYSEEEKISWVKNHLGSDWRKRIIFARDKSIIDGDYLIDDKPDIKITVTPKWEQIIFDAPYNREVKDKKRLTHWSEWKTIIV